MANSVTIDERDYLIIRNLQIVSDAEAILENLDLAAMPSPHIGTIQAEFEQLKEILNGWHKRLNERIEVIQYYRAT